MKKNAPAKWLRPHLTLLLAVIVAMAAVRAVAAPADPAAERFYVGERVCRKCHDNAEDGSQFTAWYLSAHARAYAALAKPGAERIARLSGVDGDVFESRICLGCHSTAADAEPWEMDPSFFPEDGVQCELCHGRGSDYADAATMADPGAAGSAGLRMPGEDFCRICHGPKGSHQAVLGTGDFDYAAALGKIGHKGRVKTLPPAAGEKAAPAGGPRYVGAMACVACHREGPGRHAFSSWRLSKHAGAYAVLGTQRARQIAGSGGAGEIPMRSPVCLRCHTTGYGEPPDRFDKSFSAELGVQCEACHGPGSMHIGNANRKETPAADLRRPAREVCEECHTGYHGKTFEYEPMLTKAGHTAGREEGSSRTVRYKTPVNLAVSSDGGRLYVVCEASDSVVVVDTAGRRVLHEIKVGRRPHGIALSPDGTRAFVSNRGSASVSVIDTQANSVTGTVRVGDEPHGLATDLSEGVLYVANAGSHDVSVVDLNSMKETKRLSGGRGPWGVARSRDGRFILVTSSLPQFAKFRSPMHSEVTVIDAAKGKVGKRIPLADANMILGLRPSPAGDITLTALMRTKNLVPMTRVMQGWMITNGIGVIWQDGRMDQLLLDEPDRSFADPEDVVFAPDGSRAYVSGGGVNAVAVLDIDVMKGLLRNSVESDRVSVLPNHLGLASRYVLRRIGVGNNPRGMGVSPDGRFVYVADALDDAVSVIDTQRQERVGVIGLGGTREITVERFGERLFHSAAKAFGRQFSCRSCHPDGGADGITYDLEPDGLGMNPVDNRTLRGILDTAPFKWAGTNPTLSWQCGPRLAVFFTRTDPFTPEEVKAVESYICTIPLNSNRHRTGGELTPAQRRGKSLFERSLTNDGREIPEGNRCSDCHPGPFYTSRRIEDVGTKSPLDTTGRFDVPHLNNIYETAPYLHDGRADSLEEIWTRFNPQDRHGVTNDMTKNQLNDLIEYLKRL